MLRIQIVSSFKLRGKYLGSCRYCTKSPCWSLRCYIQGIKEEYSAFGRDLIRERNEFVNLTVCEQHRQMIQKEAKQCQKRSIQSS